MKPNKLVACLLAASSLFTVSSKTKALRASSIIALGAITFLVGSAGTVGFFTYDYFKNRISGKFSVETIDLTNKNNSEEIFQEASDGKFDNFNKMDKECLKKLHDMKQDFVLILKLPNEKYNVIYYEFSPDQKDSVLAGFSGSIGNSLREINKILTTTSVTLTGDELTKLFSDDKCKKVGSHKFDPDIIKREIYSKIHENPNKIVQAPHYGKENIKSEYLCKISEAYLEKQNSCVSENFDWFYYKLKRLFFDCLNEINRREELKETFESAKQKLLSEIESEKTKISETKEDYSIKLLDLENKIKFLEAEYGVFSAKLEMNSAKPTKTPEEIGHLLYDSFTKYPMYNVQDFCCSALKEETYALCVKWQAKRNIPILIYPTDGAPRSKGTPEEQQVKAYEMAAVEWKKYSEELKKSELRDFFNFSTRRSYAEAKFSECQYEAKKLSSSEIAKKFEKLAIELSLPGEDVNIKQALKFEALLKKHLYEEETVLYI